MAQACDVAPPPNVLIVGTDTIALGPGVRTHEVELRVRTDGEFQPALIEATPGDILRMTTADGRGHALAFDGAAGDSAIRFLETTGQRRSPPLLATGSAWIIDLTDAPGGMYRIACLVHEEAFRLHIIEP